MALVIVIEGDPLGSPLLRETARLLAESRDLHRRAGDALGGERLPRRHAPHHPAAEPQLQPRSQSARTPAG